MSEIIVLPSLRQILEEPSVQRDVLTALAQENVCIVRGVINRAEACQFTNYLAGVGRSSLPNWQPIVDKCPNFHRVSDWDDRSYVKACFHQFSFFPWNDDVFGFFGRFREIFELRNILAGAERDAYIGRAPHDDCTARLSFQFYPRGGGGMNEHADPAGPHQAVVPTLILSQLGEDFKSGGAFVKDSSGAVTWIETAAGPGDLVLFDPLLPHGVAPIDPDDPRDWLSFKGRWMSIFAVNKLASNNRVAASVDLAAPRNGTN